MKLIISTLVLVQSIFSLWPVIVKLAIQKGDSSLLIVLYRDFLASIFLWIGVTIESHYFPTVKSIPPAPLIPTENSHRFIFLLMGVASSLNSVGYVVAINYVTSFNSALLHPTIPVFSLLLGAYFGAETVRTHAVLGAALCIAGSVLVVVSQGTDMISVSLLGNILLVVQSFAMSVLLVAQKFVSTSFSPLRTTAMYYSLGTLLSMPLVLLWTSIFGHAHVSISSTGIILFGSLFVISFNYAALTWVNRIGNPSVVASSMMLQPPLTYFLSYLLGTVPTVGVWEIVGGAVVVCGLLVTTLPSWQLSDLSVGAVGGVLGGRITLSPGIDNYEKSSVDEADRGEELVYLSTDFQSNKPYDSLYQSS